MGVTSDTVAAMLREAKRKPFYGTAVTFGRQTIGVQPGVMVNMFKNLLGATHEVSDFSADQETTFAKSHKNQTFVRDVDFLKALGFTEVKAVDISDFEGAEIVTDLTYPVPSSLESSCDLILDGSLLDNIFDPVTGLKNIARMLRPGGRVFITERGNTSYQSGIPYTVFTPMWFLDYFVWNDFDYCQIYCRLYPKDESVGPAVFALSLEHAAGLRGVGPNRFVRPIHTDALLGVWIYAEKGKNSTWDRTPIQGTYRSEQDWQRYREIVSRYVAEDRDLTLLSRPARVQGPLRPGWVRATYPSSMRTALASPGRAAAE